MHWNFTTQTGKIYTTPQALQNYTLVEATGQVLKAHKIYTATYVSLSIWGVYCILDTHMHTHTGQTWLKY